MLRFVANGSLSIVTSVCNSEDLALNRNSYELTSVALGAVHPFANATNRFI